MTARRLYDRYCDAVARCSPNKWDAATQRYVRRTLAAWPFLSRDEQNVWRDMARSIRDGKRYA